LYGGPRTDKVSVVRSDQPAETGELSGERLRELFEHRRKGRRSDAEAA
jgi:hypothetical protein